MKLMSLQNVGTMAIWADVIVRDFFRLYATHRVAVMVFKSRVCACPVVYKIRFLADRCY